MHLVYFDESGHTGTNLRDPVQPIFVLGALVVAESVWLALERDLLVAIEAHFPAPRPDDFEVHATEISNPRKGYFRQIAIGQRLAFRDEWFRIAQTHGLKLICRAIVKKRFLEWSHFSFGSGIAINPHVAAFPLVVRVVDELLKSLPGSPLGIIISDENKEVVADIEKAIKIFRGTESALKVGQIIEKGFFIDSKKSLVLQLCDLCVYTARKKEEQKAGLPIKPIDQSGIPLVEPLMHRGNDAFADVIAWLTAEQKKGGQGINHGVGKGPARSGRQNKYERSAWVSQAITIIHNPCKARPDTAVRQPMLPVKSKGLESIERLGFEEDFEEAGFAAVKALKPVGALFERGDGRDERGDIDVPAAQGVEAGGILAAGGAGTEDGDFARDAKLQREFDRRVDVADERDGAALAGGADGQVDGGGDAHRLENRVGPAAVCQIDYFAEGVGLGGIDGGGGAEFFGQGQPAGGEVDGDNLGAAGQAEGLDEEQADQTGAEDHGAVAGGEAGAAPGVKGNRDRFDHCGVLEGKGIGKAVEDALGEGDELGEGAVLAVFAAGDAQNAAVIAEIDLAFAAEIADAAIKGRVESDASARLPLLDGAAHFGDNAGGFVAHDNGGLAASSAAIHAMNVTAANAAGLDGDQDGIRQQLGLRHVFDREPPVFFKCQRFHARRMP